MPDLTIEQAIAAIDKAIMRLTAHGENNTAYLADVRKFVHAQQAQIAELEMGTIDTTAPSHINFECKTGDEADPVKFAPATGIMSDVELGKEARIVAVRIVKGAYYEWHIFDLAKRYAAGQLQHTPKEKADGGKNE